MLFISKGRVLLRNDLGSPVRIGVWAAGTDTDLSIAGQKEVEK